MLISVQIYVKWYKDRVLLELGKRDDLDCYYGYEEFFIFCYFNVIYFWLGFVISLKKINFLFIFQSLIEFLRKLEVDGIG